MVRIKMSRLKRASQFAPFDSLKGFKEALKIKEYEHDKIQKGELTPDKAKEISKVLFYSKNRDRVNVTCYNDGYYVSVKGKMLLFTFEGYIEILGEDKNYRIKIENIVDIKNYDYNSK